jgi:hypothetical protein
VCYFASIALSIEFTRRSAFRSVVMPRLVQHGSTNHRCFSHVDPDSMLIARGRGASWPRVHDQRVIYFNRIYYKADFTAIQLAARNALQKCQSAPVYFQSSSLRHIVQIWLGIFERDNLSCRWRLTVHHAIHLQFDISTKSLEMRAV